MDVENPKTINKSKCLYINTLQFLYTKKSNKTRVAQYLKG